MKTNRGTNLWKALLWLLPAAFLLVFFYQPLTAILRLAFSMLPTGTGAEQGFQLSLVANTFGFTLWQAALSTLLTLVVGLPAAYLFSHFEFAGRKFLRLVALLPFILPTVVTAVCFNSLLGPRGWLNLGLMALFNLIRAADAYAGQPAGHPAGACVLQQLRNHPHCGRRLEPVGPQTDAGGTNAGR
jgi:thiamine transport system permease protein